MARQPWVLTILFCGSLLNPTSRADEPPKVPTDFKLVITSYSVRAEPVLSEDVVIRAGRAYVFPSNSKEVIIIEPARKQLELLDVSRKLQTEVTFQALDESLLKIRQTLLEAADQREKEGGRAKLIEAKMTRDLFETKLDAAEAPGSKRIRLTNPSIEIEAIGEPELDLDRLAIVATSMTTMARLGAYRSPTDLPPFAELQAIDALTGSRKLRPVELIYVYRLAGPPRKFRRTYRISPILTDRDLEAINRVDKLREIVPSVRFERYRLVR